MALVDYASDSESGSDTEQAPAPVPAPKPSTTAKPAFQKLVDSSGRVKLDLPTTATAEDDNEDRPAKRAKTGGVSDFLSFLPAPKRTGPNAVPPPSSSAQKSTSELKPARAPITLKGAGPAFSRSTGNDDEYDEMGAPINKGSGGGMSLPPPRAQPQPSAIGKPAEEVKMVGLGKPMMFKPLSVGKRPVKKKKTTATTERGTVAASLGSTAATKPQEVQKAQTQTQAQQEPPKPKQKVSLFSTAADIEDDDEDEEPASSSAAAPNPYQPMNHRAQRDLEAAAAEASNPYLEPNPTYLQYQASKPAPATSANLSDIASDLNLSAAERRQLFGRSNRSGKDQSATSATKVINFNTDQEYQHNEELRALGEPAPKNPVRAIAPGKHSLQQLVSQVQSQKEALEESFVRGRVNKKEAGSRYGW